MADLKFTMLVYLNGHITSKCNPPGGLPSYEYLNRSMLAPTRSCMNHPQPCAGAGDGQPEISQRLAERLRRLRWRAGRLPGTPARGCPRGACLRSADLQALVPPELHTGLDSSGCAPRFPCSHLACYIAYYFAHYFAHCCRELINCDAKNNRNLNIKNTAPMVTSRLTSQTSRPIHPRQQIRKIFGTCILNPTRPLHLFYSPATVFRLQLCARVPPKVPVQDSTHAFVTKSLM